MPTTIDSLQLEIQATGESATKGLDALISTLTKLDSATKGLDLSNVSAQIKKVAEGVNQVEADKASGLAQVLDTVRDLGEIKISTSIPNGIKRIGEAAKTIDTADIQKVKAMGEALQGFKGVENVKIPNIKGSPVGGDMGNSANNAASQIDSVSDSSSRLQSILASVQNTLANVLPFGASMFGRMNSEAQTGASRVRELGNQLAQLPVNTVDRVASSIKNFTARLKDAISMVGRIALMMTIRNLIRGIRTALNEGIQNLYNWSKSVGDTFSKSLDKIKTASQYLKNSFATLAAPLINLVAPVIDIIVDKIVDLINLINMFVAKLTGQTTYTAAKKISTAWGEASEKSGKAAKQIQRTLMGFDELNTVGKSVLGDTGSGSGTDFGSMFEQRPIDSDFSAFIDKIKGMLTEITAIKSLNLSS